MLTHKTFLYLSLITALLCMAHGVVVVFIILYANEKLGYTLLESGFVLSLVMFSGTVGRILWGVISDRIYNARRKPILIIITVLAVVTVVALSVWDVSWHRWLLISVFVGLGLSTAGWNSIVLTWIAEITAKSKTATSIGLSSTIGWLGFSSGPIAFGSIIDHYGFFCAWMSLAFFCICALIFCIFLPESDNRG
ncbi:MAG: MFS transporter [Deltaproteobacteria bacterium]|nr:MFS transporter [Deltaproteobacteria bacterium]